MADNFMITSSIVTQDWAKRLNYNRRFPKKNKTPYDIRAELDLTFPTIEFERIFSEIMSDNTGKYAVHQKAPIMKIIDKNPNDFRKLQEELRMRIMVNKLSCVICKTELFHLRAKAIIFVRRQYHNRISPLLPHRHTRRPDLRVHPRSPGDSTTRRSR